MEKKGILQMVENTEVVSTPEKREVGSLAEAYKKNKGVVSKLMDKHLAAYYKKNPEANPEPESEPEIKAPKDFDVRSIV